MLRYLIPAVVALSWSAATPGQAQDHDNDTIQFLEGHIPGSPLYHVSMHVHFKEPYYGGPNSHNWPQRDWYIGGLSTFRRNQIRGPIVTESLKTDHPAKVLSFEETGLGESKIIDHKLAVSIVDSAIYLKRWLLQQEFPYSGIPIRGIGLTSNSIVRAILMKNNAYPLWSDLNYPHIAPGTGQNDPGIPGYDEEPLKFPLIGEFLFWGILMLIFVTVIKVVALIRAKLTQKTASGLTEEMQVKR